MLAGGKHTIIYCPRTVLPVFCEWTVEYAGPYSSIVLLPGIGFTKMLGVVCMSAKFTDLHCKEVICISDGRRLGMIEDVIIQLPKGEVSAIVVPGRCKLGGLGPPRDDFVIPWCNICRIGPDIVLVDIKPEDCRVLRGRPKLIF